MQLPHIDNCFSIEKDKIIDVLERPQIGAELKWNLEALYADLKLWRSDFEKIDPMLKHLNELKGCLADSPETIKTAFELEDDISRLLEKLSAYVRHKSDENTADNQNLALLGKISSKDTLVDAETAWIEPEILAIDEEKLRQFAQSPGLSFYKKTLDDLIIMKPHTLSADEEKILGLVSDSLSTSYDTFILLSNADMRFPKIKNEKGDDVELTQSNFVTFLRTEDRNIRKNAFEKMYETYSGFQNTFASLLDGTVKADVFGVRTRKFRDCLDDALFEDKIPASLYHNLISSARKNLPVIHKYYGIRKKALKLDELHLYDMYNNIAATKEQTWTWDEAKEAVINSLEPLGKNYQREAKQAFDERWIDVLPRRGKKSGAYSGGCYDSHPYILMNFQGTLDDVFTLAHELGHSMHSFYANKAQSYHYADYSIFLAEIASITSELLLHEHLIKTSKDKNFRAVLINHLLDEFRATVVRQTMFAEFELIIHKHREEDETLTADFLKEKYYRLVCEYFGEKVFCDKLIEYEWARIPHFHYGFYVYKYATGFAASAKFAKRLIDGDRGALDDYVKFLECGSSRDVLDILKTCGIEPESNEFINDSFLLFGKKMEDLPLLS